MEQRKEILLLLDKAMELYPEMRIGQLVTNIAYWAKGPSVSAAWDVENQEFIDAIKEHLKKRERL